MSVGTGRVKDDRPTHTSTPSGRAMFQMCGVFAEFERGMIRERVHAGLARARPKGTKLGRRSGQACDPGSHSRPESHRRGHP